jgi:hypothetical protein
MADNGLAFRSFAEAASLTWSRKALGIQNTGQFVAAPAVGPCVEVLMASVGNSFSFGGVAIAPLAAIRLVPPRDRHAVE